MGREIVVSKAAWRVIAATLLSAVSGLALAAPPVTAAAARETGGARAPKTLAGAVPQAPSSASSPGPSSMSTRPRTQSMPDEAFLAARRAFAAGDAGGFDAALQRMGEHPLADYPRYWALTLDLRRQQGAGEIGAITRYLRESPNRLLATQLGRETIRMLGRRERWQALQEVAGLIAPGDDLSAQCYLWAAQLASQQSIPIEARDAMMAPQELGEGCSALLGLAFASGRLRAGDLRERVRIAAETGAMATARRAVGLLGLDTRELGQAVREPDRFSRAGDTRDPDAMAVALALLAREQPQVAAERLQRLGDTLPASGRDYAWAAIASQGAQRLVPEAAEWARRGVRGKVSDPTLGWLARAGLVAGDWTLVRAALERMSSAGRDDSVWIYWEARALRMTGSPGRADALLGKIAGQLHFYGQLAAEELGQTVTPAPAAPVTAAEADQAQRTPGLVRALKFYELGLQTDGNREWNFALREFDDRQLLAAADLACRQMIHDRCINTADRTREQHNLSWRFLMPYRDRLTELARRHDLDPAWVYGLIRQESRFQSHARSHVGAQGLMQIMPATGSWIARQVGHADYRVSDLGDTDLNMRFGTFYLRDVASRLDRSEVLASAGYNAGPGRPARWRQALAGVVDGAIFAEVIPFTETRDYVKKVMWNATWYATLLGNKAASLRERLGRIGPRTTAAASAAPASAPAPMPAKAAAPVQAAASVQAAAPAPASSSTSTPTPVAAPVSRAELEPDASAGAQADADAPPASLTFNQHPTDD